jgi:hypothetical protein
LEYIKKKGKDKVNIGHMLGENVPKGVGKLLKKVNLKKDSFFKKKHYCFKT